MNISVVQRWLSGSAYLKAVVLSLASALALGGLPAWANEATSLTRPDAPAVTVDDWLSQIAQSLVTITGVRVEETAAGAEIVLETDGSVLPTPSTQTTGNALRVTIPNAVLALPDGDSFEQFTPAEGIALISVTSLSGDQVQVAITGTDAPPTAQATAAGLSVALGEAITNDEEEAIQLTVTGEEDEGYAPSNATTATRTDTLLRDIPQSIQVIPQEVIEDQAITRLDDALRNVSGVTQNSADPRGQRFQVRGFDSSSVLRDGFALTFGGSFGNSGFQELANIERVEVLKGPAAILYGSGQPGGIINLVTERPLSTPFYDLGLSAGNRGLIEPSLDISGPLTEDGRLLYRLNALYRREDYYRDFDVPVERFFIAPVLQWKISDRTDLLVNVEYLNDRRPADFGLVAVGDRVADIPFDRNLGELDDELTAELFRVGYQFEHDFSENWSIRNAFNFLTEDVEYQLASTLDFDETTGSVTRYFENGDSPINQYELQTNLTGRFQTGTIDHQLLVGLDLQRRNDGLPNEVFRGDFDDTTELNIFNPIYGATRPALEDNPVYFMGDFRNNRLGVFLQDLIALSDNLKLLAGIRYDAVWQDFTTTFLQNTTETSEFTEAFSPRLGIVYQPTEELSFYGSYNQSFFPNSASNIDGDILPAEKGEQFEVGIRGEFLDGRLISNLALFNLTRQNVATTDPTNSNFSIATGEQRSRGVELDVAGEILPGWNIIANYAYIDAEITEDNDLPVGNRLFNVPEHSFNLWTNYEIQTGDLQGLGFGLGANFVGERFGDLDNSFTVDNYFLTNAAISYERDNWQAALNFRNLFDVDYIQGTENGRTSEIYPGQGFTIVGSISVEF